MTGGTAGVGRAAVREFARVGYDVAVLARGAAGLRGAVADVEAAGRRALAIPTDVADAAAVEAAAERVESELGRDRGVIVNVGSAMAYRAIPLQSAYCGAKHAIKGFSEAVMTELAAESSKVRLCMVQLPGLNTPQFTWNLNKMPGHPRPVAPVFQPELAARAIQFLAEHPRRSIWVGVSTAYTILGERAAPLLVRAFLVRTGVSGQQTDADLPRYGANVFGPPTPRRIAARKARSTTRRCATTRCRGRRCTAWRSSPCSPAPRWPLSRASGCAGADRRRLGADGHRPGAEGGVPYEGP